MENKTTIGDFFDLIGGGTPSTKIESYWGEGIPWISSADIDESGKIEYRRKVTKKGIVESTTNAVPLGTPIVVTRVGLGKVTIAPYELCFSQDMQALFPKNESIIYESSYLLYQLLYIMSRKKYSGQGTTISGITKKQLSDCNLYLPDISEQQRIVSRIAELFSSLDNAVETLQKTKEQLAVYRQAVLKEAFEGEWEFERAEELCDFITKGTTPKKVAMAAGDGEIPFIKVYNLTFDNSLDFSIEPTFVSKDIHNGFLSRSITKPGDVLINIVGPPIGKVSIVPDTYPEWNINQAIARFRCKERLYNKFLAYYLGFSETVEKMKKEGKATAGQFNLTLEICRNVLVPVPDYMKQKEIVEWIESRLSVCDSIEQTVNTALTQAEAMRQSILKEAFEGRL